VISEFLGDRESFDDECERMKKQEFLNHLTKVIRGHWGMGWHMITHPLGQVIRVDKTFTKAILDCRIIYQWGWAYLEKRNNKWELLEAELPVIE
jgi:hypothetical protein